MFKRHRELVHIGDTGKARLARTHLWRY